MARLLRDRYFVDEARCAWDLVTGEWLPADATAATPEDDGPRLDPVIEVLDHGREGVPRWIVADVGPPGSWPSTVRRLAADARARGYVALTVDSYVRLRAMLAEDLAERTLLLVAESGTPASVARAALLDAAARSPRSHVLITCRTGRPPREFVVREATAVYGAAPVSDVAPAARVAPAAPVARTAARTAERRAPVAAEVLQLRRRAERAREHVAAGRHAAAERVLREVMAALVRRRAHAAAAQTGIELGRLLLERGRAVAAETIAGEAADAAHEGTDERLMIDARIWQAAARVDAWQLTAAESLSRAVLVSGGATPSQRARALATLARVLLWQGRVRDLSLPEWLPDAADCGEPDQFAYVGATRVRCLLATGQLFEAGVCAGGLLTEAVARDPLARVMALSAQLRVSLAAGDLAIAHERLRAIETAARAAHVPLRAARAMAAWVEALVRVGRAGEAGRERAWLRRIRAASPPALRRAIDRVLPGGADDGRAASDRMDRVARFVPDASRARAAGLERSVAESVAPSEVAQLIRMAHEADDDRAAVTAVIERLARETAASRMSLWSADAGPPTAIVSVGNGLPVRLAARVIEAGLALGPEASDSGHEAGVPVRLGPRLLGALVGRWPADRVPPPTLAPLELAAAVMAARVDALITERRDAAAAATTVPELVGTSEAMREVRRAIARAAAAPFAVLIEGESGVGKELAARAIHQLGPRRDRRLCDVNCAALPDDLFEAELFGHARGAFTGALVERAGLFEEADGGTLFMDELADLSLRAQAKLLRVLQQQEVRRLGESFSRPIDVRIVTAANRDMRAEAAGGRFRQDLLYRLEVIRIRLPPLRERPEDIALLARHFWRAAAARVGTRAVLTHRVIAALTRYGWPGNVRELQNAIAALAVAAPAHGKVRESLLPAAITGAAAVTAARFAEARWQFERRFVEAAIARAGGCRSRAAREIGLSRQGLLKMMARLGMAPAKT